MSKLVYEQAYVKGSLYDTGLGYPALDFNGEDITYGEVYEVTNDVLYSLDVLEGYEEGRTNNLYDRKIVQVFTDESSIQAYVYTIAPSNRDLLKEKIDNGDWKLYKFLNENPLTFMYFAYGSCMDTERFHEQGVRHLFERVMGVGELQNYTLCYSRHSHDGGRADIKEGTGYVEGILYLLPLEALHYLFDREGVHAQIYRPVFVDIEWNNQTLEDVLSFTVINKEEDIAPPDHYALEILRGAKGRVSDNYYQLLRKQMADLGVDVRSIEEQI